MARANDDGLPGAEEEHRLEQRGEQRREAPRQGACRPLAPNVGAAHAGRAGAMGAAHRRLDF